MDTVKEEKNTPSSYNFRGSKNFYLYKDVQNAIRNVKISKYINESKSIVAEGTSFWGAINGENTLQLERIRNINLKMELLQCKRIEYSEEYTLKDMLADLYACATMELNGKFTPEMKKIYNKIKEQYYWENDGHISDKELCKLAYKKIDDSQSYLPIIHKEKKNGIFGDTKVQLNFYRVENEKLEEKIILEKAKSQRVFSSRKKAYVVIPNNVKLAVN